MDRITKALVAVAPGPVIAWIADLFEVFDRTYIIRPGSSPHLARTAIALGLVLTLVACGVWVKEDAGQLARLCFRSLGAAALAFIYILGVRYWLAQNPVRRTAETLYFAYDLGTLVFMCAALLAIVFAILSAENRH